MKKMIKLTFAVSAVALLAACGGGGSVANNAAQGIWVNTSADGLTQSMVILENGETWSGASMGERIFAWVNGVTTITGNNLSQQVTFLSPLALTQSVTQTGTFVAKSTLSAINPQSQASTQFTYLANYDNAAVLSAISGIWGFNGTYSNNPSVSDPTLTPINASISTNGVFSLTQEGCNIAGVLSPRPGGKNVFNLGLITSGSNCVSNRNIMSGIAYIDTSVTPNQFNLIAITPNKKDGLFLIASRVPAPI